MSAGSADGAIPEGTAVDCSSALACSTSRRARAPPPARCCRASTLPANSLPGMSIAVFAAGLPCKQQCDYEGNAAIMRCIINDWLKISKPSLPDCRCASATYRLTATCWVDAAMLHSTAASSSRALSFSSVGRCIASSSNTWSVGTFLHKQTQTAWHVPSVSQTCACFIQGAFDGEKNR